MIRIGFVGNCQTLGLLIYFKDLLQGLNYELNGFVIENQYQIGK